MPRRDGSVLFSGHSICTEMRRSFLSLSDEYCLFGNAVLPVIDSYCTVMATRRPSHGQCKPRYDTDSDMTVILLAYCQWSYVMMQ